MLADRVRQCAERGRAAARNRELVDAYGEFIKGLAPWSWFATITSRFAGGVSHKRVGKFLAELTAASKHPVGWVIAWEHGEIGGHLHCHILISGVDDLNVNTWCRRANARFGSAHFDVYDPQQAGAFYLAKNGFTGGGDLDFGGSLSGDNSDGRDAGKLSDVE